MQGTTLPFYVRGNTARGPWNLLRSSLEHLDRLVVLPAVPGPVQTEIIRLTASALSATEDIWLLHRPEDDEGLDGLVIPSRRVGLVREEALAGLAGMVPASFIVEKAELSALWPDQENAPVSLKGAEECTAREIASMDLAYAGFAKALAVHDDWEAIYIGRMNFAAADRLADEYVARLYGGRPLTDMPGRCDDRFLGAATPAGALDCVPQLTGGLKRFLIKGRAGSGKSTLLKRLAAEGRSRGFDTEVYHCGFDPNSIDMVIVRDLGFAVFDSTAPHEYFPEHDTDEIIDMYEACIEPGTDEAFAEELAVLKARYAALMKEAIAHLADAKQARQLLERPVAEAVDREALRAAAAEWTERLLR